MQKQLNIHIPEPCHQDWNAMTQKEQGRFCSSCDKIVIDFTQMNGQDIIRYFKETTETGTCGRFKQTQLSLPIPLPEEVKVSLFRRHFSSPIQRLAAVFLTGIIFFFSSCKPGFTQGEITVPREQDSLNSETKDSIMPEILKPADSLKPVKSILKPKDDNLNLIGNIIKIPKITEPVLTNHESMITGKIAFKADSTQH